MIDEILAPKNWEFTSSEDKLFSTDHIIDAYLKGKNEGLEQQERLIIEKLISNIDKSGKHTTQVINHLLKKGLNPTAAFLKINSWDNFETLIIISEKDFLSTKMLKVYEYISKLESKVSEDMYYLQISFHSKDENIDEESIRSDGYILKHKMQNGQEKTKTRNP